MARTKRRKAAAQQAVEDGTGGKPGKRGGRGAWKVLDRGSTVLAGLLAREVSVLTWRAATGRKPPTAGRHPEVETREAVAWAVIGGALVEVVKLVVRRWTASYWVRSTGGLPPGMKPLKPSIGGATGIGSDDTGLDAKEPAPEGEPARSRPTRGRRSRR